MGFPELATQYQIIVDRPDALDVFTVKVELTEKASKGSSFGFECVQEQCSDEDLQYYGLTPLIDAVKPGEIPRTEGKAKRVINLEPEKYEGLYGHGFEDWRNKIEHFSIA